MKSFLIGIVTLIAGVGVGYGIGQVSAAQQSVKNTMLLTVDMDRAPAKEAKMWITEIAPGERTPKHYHPGDVVAYVLEGSVIHTVEGKEPVTFTAGQAFHESAKDIHWGTNPSQSIPVKLLTVQITDKGQPSTVPVK